MKQGCKGQTVPQTQAASAICQSGTTYTSPCLEQTKQPRAALASLALPAAEERLQIAHTAFESQWRGRLIRFVIVLKMSHVLLVGGRARLCHEQEKLAPQPWFLQEEDPGNSAQRQPCDGMPDPCPVHAWTDAGSLPGQPWAVVAQSHADVVLGFGWPASEHRQRKHTYVCSSRSRCTLSFSICIQ